MAKDTKAPVEEAASEPATEPAPAVENAEIKALEAKIETQGYVTTAQAERLRELRQLAI